MAAAAKTKQRDFFADVEVPNRYLLKDKVSFIEHQKLDEGIFQQYQNLTSSVKMSDGGETTEIDMKLGAQRDFLFRKLVKGWNLVRRSKDDDGNEVEKPVQFSYETLRKLPPEVLTGLMEDIYEKNPILSGEKGEEGKDDSKS